MHPADVAEHVAYSVDVLRNRLDSRSDLASAKPVLDDHVHLYIPFEKVERQLVSQAVGTGFVLPGGQANAAFVHEVPLLGAQPTKRPLLLYMDLEDYDGQPPTAELLQPDRTPLPAALWPRAIGGVGIVANHRDYNRPFFCRRGLRDYHSHPQHEDDPWDRHREELTLADLVIELLVDLRSKWIGR